MKTIEKLILKMFSMNTIRNFEDNQSFVIMMMTDAMLDLTVNLIVDAIVDYTVNAIVD